MRAIQLTAYGNPVEGLKLCRYSGARRSRPRTKFLIGVEFSPLNPSDLLLANGIYALHPAAADRHRQ